MNARHLALFMAVLVLAPIIFWLPGRAAPAFAHIPPAPTANSLPAGADSGVELVEQFGGLTISLDVQGNYAYLGIGPRLHVLELSDPDHPSLVGRSAPIEAANSPIHSIAVLGNYAYIANGSSGLLIFDVSNPTAPTIVGNRSWGNQSYAWRVSVQGNYAYVADRAGFLRVIDVTNPATPIEVGSTPSSGSIQDLTVAGNHAYLTYGSGLNFVKLAIFDVSNPSAPGQIADYSMGQQSPFSSIAIVGNHAYIAADTLKILDVTDPAAPSQVGGPFLNQVYSIAVSGSFAYIGGSYTLHVVNVANPASPEVTGSTPIPEGPLEVALSGNHLFFATWRTGLQVASVADPSHPELTGSFDPPAAARDVALVGDYAYVADGEGRGLDILDVANPSLPVPKGSAYILDGSGGGVRNVEVAGHFAYVAAEGGGLRIVNVADPSAPTEVGFYSPGAAIMNVAVAGNYAYLAGSGGLQVVDVSNPSAPELVGSLPTSGNASGIAVAGNYVYLTTPDNHDEGLRIIDVTTPSAPIERSFHRTTDANALNVAVAGNYAYVIQDGSNYNDEKDGLLILDVSNPADPVEVSFRNLPYALNVAVAGHYAYVSGGNGIHIFDTSAPASPVPLGSHRAFGEAVAVKGDYIFVAGGSLKILRFEAPGVPLTQRLYLPLMQVLE